MAKVIIKYHLIAIVFALILAGLSLMQLLVIDTKIIPEYRDIVFPAQISTIAQNYFSAYPSYEGIARFWFSIFILISENVEVFSRLIMIFFYLTAFLAPYFGIFYLVKRILKSEDYIAFWSGLVAGFFYSLNLYFLQSYSPPYTYVISYALLPLILYFTLKVCESKKNIYQISLAIVITLSITPIMRYIIIVCIVVLSAIILYLLFLKEKDQIKQIVIKFFKILLITILINSYWLLPAIVASTQTGLAPAYEVTYDIINVFSEKYSSSDKFLTQASWWPFMEIRPFGGMNDNILKSMIFLFYLLFLSCFLFLKKETARIKLIAIYAFLLYSLTLFLWGGVSNFNEVFGSAYESIVFSLPKIFRWMFRMPGYFGSMSILAVCIMITIFLNIVFKRFGKNFGFVISLFFILYTVAFGWQRLSGDLDGLLRKGYYVEDTKNYQVVRDLFPTFLMLNYDGPLKANHLNFDYTKIPNSKKNFISQGMQNVIDYNYAVYLLKNYGSNALILNEDTKVVNVSKKSDFEMQSVPEDFTRLYINTAATNDRVFGVPLSNIFYVFNSDEITFDAFSKFNKEYFYTSDKNLHKDIPNILVSNVEDEIILKNAIKIAPANHTNRFQPDLTWSKAYTSDPLHAAWHPYLKDKKIENWQSDIGYGLLFSNNNSGKENQKIEIRFSIKESAQYKIDAKIFKNVHGGLIEFSIDGVRQKISSTDKRNLLLWESLGNHYLQAGYHVLVIENLSGLNAVNVVTLNKEALLALSREQMLTDLHEKNNYFIFEAENDFSRENINMVFDSKYSNNKAALICNSRLETKIEIFREDSYDFLLGASKNVIILVDGKSLTASANETDEKRLYQTHLSKGTHNIAIIGLIKGRAKNDCVFDNLWVYNTKQTEDLSIKTNSDVQVNKIKRTKYGISLNINEAMILVFTERYDSMWKINNKKQAGLLVSPNSVKINDSVNGYYINGKKVSLEATIYYEPQKYFYIGLFISGLTLLGCLSYLSYDFYQERKKKLVAPTQ